MFQTLIYPSSGACDCVDELPHRSSCSQFVVCWRTVVLQPAKWTLPNTNRNKSSNTQQTENKKTDVVIHQHSRKLLKMDILMSETCWVHNKWNKITSDIKLVFHSSTIAMMHGPINIRYLCMLLARHNHNAELNLSIRRTQSKPHSQNTKHTFGQVPSNGATIRHPH